MLIEARFDVAIECSAATPMILQLSIHPSRGADQDAPIGWRRGSTRRATSRRVFHCCPRAFERIIFGLPASPAPERLKSDRPNPAGFSPHAGDGPRGARRAPRRPPRGSRTRPKTGADATHYDRYGHFGEKRRHLKRGKRT